MATHQPPEQFAGHTLHCCVDTGRGVVFQPPMGLNLLGMKVWDGQAGEFVVPDPASSIKDIFTDGAVIALPERRKAGAA